MKSLKILRYFIVSSILVLLFLSKLQNHSFIMWEQVSSSSEIIIFLVACVHSNSTDVIQDHAKKIMHFLRKVMDVNLVIVK